jgi:hypothetical protein
MGIGGVVGEVRGDERVEGVVVVGRARVRVVDHCTWRTIFSGLARWLSLLRGGEFADHGRAFALGARHRTRAELSGTGFPDVTAVLAHQDHTGRWLKVR